MPERKKSERSYKFKACFVRQRVQNSKIFSSQWHKTENILTWRKLNLQDLRLAWDFKLDTVSIVLALVLAVAVRWMNLPHCEVYHRQYELLKAAWALERGQELPLAFLSALFWLLQWRSLFVSAAVSQETVYGCTLTHMFYHTSEDILLTCINSQRRNSKPNIKSLPESNLLVLRLELSPHNVTVWTACSPIILSYI